MRLTGWVLLLIGGLLCATISWAALGFLLMGVGLIALQVAERGRRPADAAVPAGVSGFTPPHLSDGLQPPTLDPVAGQDTGQRQPRRVAWPDKNNDAPYDREAWRRLVESDPDLAQIANVLADYGPQYVDELAASYLAAPDKGRLAAIVDGIVARARDGQAVPLPPVPAEASRPPPLPPRPAPKPVTAPAAKPATSPSNSADALEASLLATVEEASARIAAERAGLFKPAKEINKELNKEPGEATDSRPQAAGQRQPLFGRAPRDAKPAEPPPVPASPPPMPAAPPPMPADTPADLEASLIAAVSEAAVRRADAKDTPKPALEPAPSPAKREPEIGSVAPASPPAPPAKTPPAKTPADNLDETLLAALAEISGQKIKGEPKPDSASKGPSGPPDDGLSDMIKKFAPDSNFLRKT
ncbi:MULTISPECIES: hypothetical protein [Bradyrhizobium]|uniref:hypothetical protein n=1 Tax=Bradyrhizobium TaxID=374 RepID=UPI0004AF2DD6|nr:MULTISPECIES: hypothetical protein [Bradyrhizobium]MCS3453379.1 hypothetical protein [Bradyrhizobium elkanii]MCS3564513.1 hypothetical protein [Bradyrhizobium elkanii]MCW2145655.1 hypothetical protein [Bradyrhizobium elkanii]MCW2355526.1 hypothetical protein [Bradyrhizobium elkanii]MCW2378482.1 hypothetical protein [Bradyrhizobium elkanii]